MAVQDAAGAGNLLQSPAIACWGSTVIFEVQIVSGNGEVLAFGTLGSSNWLALGTDGSNILTQLTSVAGGALGFGAITQGQRFWAGWVVDGSGNLQPFIGTTGFGETTGAVYFPPSTLTAPNTTDVVSIFGLPGFGNHPPAAGQNLAIYNSALTQAQIETAIGTAGFTSAWAYYPLASLADLTDHSGNGRAALTQTGSNTNATLLAINNPSTYSQANTTILCCGNSKTLGQGATTSYPAFLATALPAATVVNNGHAAHDSAGCFADAADDVLGHFVPGKLNSVWMFEYTNDDILDHLTSSQIVTSMQKYANYVRAFGFYLIMGNGAAVTGGDNTLRTTSNAGLVGTTRANGALCDMASDANLNTPTNLTYFQSDGIHWTNAGNQSAEIDFLATYNAWLATFTTITSQPSNANVVVGGTATFSVVATGISITYQWQLLGVNVSAGSGGTTASYTTPTLNIGDNGNAYTCVVTGTGGVATSTTAILTTFWNVTGTQSDGPIGTLAIGTLPSSGGGGGTTYFQTVSAAASSAASLVRTPGITRAVVSTVALSLIRQVQIARSITSTSSAAFLRQLALARAFTATGTASLFALKTRLLPLTVISTSAASVVRQVQLTKGATASGGAAVVRQLGIVRALTGAMAATLSMLKTRLASLTASASAAGALMRQVGIVRSVSGSTSAAAMRQAQLAPTATATSTASVVRQVGLVRALTAVATALVVRSVLRVLGATASAAATVAKGFAYLRTFSASSTAAAALVRQVGIVRAVGASSAAVLSRIVSRFLTLTAVAAAGATVSRLIARTFAASSSAAATVAKGFAYLRTISASSSTATAVVRQVRLSRIASSGNTASIQRSVSRVFSVASAASLAVVRMVSRALAATSSAAATMTRGNTSFKVLSATSTAAASLVRRIGRSIATGAGNAVGLARAMTRTLAVTVATSAVVTRARTLVLSAAGTASALVTAVVHAGGAFIIAVGGRIVSGAARVRRIFGNGRKRKL